ncbi:hypothetical protein F5Y16DRAFT_387563 [Xylariaceae sp. FL0255]|nr:hypothetical protein F5Y16DRAFT_387563 [Xylariaceae sp. FL0255]
MERGRERAGRLLLDTPLAFGIAFFTTSVVFFPSFTAALTRNEEFLYGRGMIFFFSSFVLLGQTVLSGMVFATVLHFRSMKLTNFHNLHVLLVLYLAVVALCIRGSLGLLASVFGHPNRFGRAK